MSKPFHIGVMDTVDAILLLLLLLRRATPNSPRTTDRCAAADRWRGRAAVPVLSLFSLIPPCFWVKRLRRGEGLIFIPRNRSRVPGVVFAKLPHEGGQDVVRGSQGESFCQVFNGGKEDSSYILASLLLLLRRRRPIRRAGNSEAGMQAGSITQQRLSSELCRFSSSLSHE